MLVALKLQLYWALGKAQINRAELSRRLGWKRESVDRLFRIDHQSKASQMDAAFKALDRRLDVHVE